MSTERPDIIELHEIREALDDHTPVSVETILAENEIQPLQLDLFREGLVRTIERYEEGGYGGGTELVAPWTPVPLHQAQEFIASNKAYALEMIFPTVFEEDRSIKIKDIATAQGLDYASHRWSAEQVAKELGREDFDYDREMLMIKRERVTLPPPPALPGMEEIPPGEAPEDSSGGKPAPQGGEFGKGATPRVQATLKNLAPSDEEAPGHRSQLSGPVVAEFKRQQRQSEANQKLFVQTMSVLTETMKTIADKMSTPPSVTVTPPPVVIPPSPAAAPAPPGEVTVRNEIIMPDAPPVVTPPERTFEVIERDQHGFAKTFRERYLPKGSV
jgi:hypothetical protein